MRVGHLIEHEQRAVRIDVVEADGLERSGFEGHALMHRIGSEQPVEILRGCGLGLEPALGDQGRQPVGGIVGGEQAQDGPVRIGEGGLDGVQAEDEGCGRISACGECRGLPRGAWVKGLEWLGFWRRMRGMAFW